jgi:hypothetical protein
VSSSQNFAKCGGLYAYSLSPPFLPQERNGKIGHSCSLGIRVFVAVAVRKVDVVAETREEDGEVRVQEQEPAGDATGAPAAGSSPGNAVTGNV